MTEGSGRASAAMIQTGYHVPVHVFEVGFMLYKCGLYHRKKKCFTKLICVETCRKSTWLKLVLQSVVQLASKLNDVFLFSTQSAGLYVS